MEPIQQPAAGPELRHVASLMERVMGEIRRHWFNAILTDTPGVLSVVEPGGEILMCVDCEEEEADALIAGAVSRGAYMVCTGLSRPSDLGARLKRAGYRPIQQHWTYLFNPQSSAPPKQRQRPRLISILPWSDPPSIEVDLITLAELRQWNEVSWQAFGARGTLDDSLNDKLRAYQNMGAQGSWYMARFRGRPVGTACIYRGRGASQILAVGTLPGFRGRGIATAVVERVIGDWQSGTESILFLDARAGSSAERIYTRLGFRPLYLRELYAPPPR